MQSIYPFHRLFRTIIHKSFSTDICIKGKPRSFGTDSEYTRESKERK